MIITLCCLVTIDFFFVHPQHPQPSKRLMHSELLMMERGGRKQRGCINGLEMIDEMKRIWKRMSIDHNPLIVVAILTADIQTCKAHGVDIVVHGNHTEAQYQVIEQLNQRLKGFI